MAITVRALSNNLKIKWDLFVNQSNDGTIFHRLGFLDYHQNKFSQHEQHISFLKGDSLFGVMPLALFQNDSGEIIGRSPYGGSYGGPIFERPLDYSTAMEVVKELLSYLRAHQVSKLSLTLPISCCSTECSDTFRLALLENGFKCVNRDISSVVSLRFLDKIITSRVRNAVRKAQSLGVHVTQNAPLSDFWPLLVKTYQKIGKPPTHSLEDLQFLHEAYPKQIFFDVAYIQQQPVAGMCHVVVNDKVDSSFYLVSDPELKDSQALSLVVYEALKTSKECGYHWFDFGTSSTQQVGQAGIFRFKEGFGALGFFREQYIWEEFR